MTAASAHLTPRALFFGGREQFLYSGEVHYFRIAPERWATTLEKSKEAGLNAICSYVPWNWHEPEPGQFDFTGESHPQRNLVRFLDLVAESGLYLHFRPGPTIISEWRHGGFPDWLLRQHPEVLALNAANNPPDLDMLYPPVTYLHPTFLAHVENWYRQVMPLVLNHPAALLAVQIDNELIYGWGLRAGDPLFIDYNPYMVGEPGAAGFYQRWLASKYGEIGRLNERYQRSFAEFAEVQPPRSALNSMQALPWYQDWHYCKEAMANEFVEFLYDLLVELGVEAPLTMLSPYLTPYGVRRFADHFHKAGKPILITTQCYPTLFGPGGYSEETSGHVAALMQVSRDWLVGSGQPFISTESQSAMSFHLPPRAMEAFYTLQIGQGLAGINFYMMAGGENPERFGMNTGASYDVSAPIGHDGTLRPHYAVVQRLGQFLRNHDQRLLNTSPLLDLAVGYYPPYETASLQGDTVRAGARQRYAELLSQIFGLGTGAIARGSGIFSLLTAAGYTYAMLDLERTPLTSLQSYRQLWCLGLDFMAAEVQEKLVEYVAAGGHLVLLPQVPQLDDAMQPSSILAALFGAPVCWPQTSIASGSRQTPWHLVTVGAVKGLPISDTVDVFDLSAQPGAEACAFDERSRLPCGYTVSLGNGKATLLGFKPRYGWNNHQLHRDFIHTVTGWGHIRPHAAAEGGELVVVERADGNSGFLFVVNSTQWPQSARIYYQDPATQEAAVLPRTLREMTLPDQGGLILCLRTPIPGTEIEVVYTTSQLQSWHVGGTTVELTLYGPRDTMGEIALARPLGAELSVSGAAVRSVQPEAENTIVTYQHAPGPFNLVANLRY